MNQEIGPDLRLKSVNVPVYRGQQIPHLTVHQDPGLDEGVAVVVLDNRWQFDIPREHLPAVLSLVANAMAVAQGRACHGYVTAETGGEIGGD